MSIKRMLFPLFVIVLAFLAVNFIRPAVLSVLDQRAAKEVQLAELSAVRKTASNVGTLSAAREAFLNSEAGRMFTSYLPTKPDHDRVVDVLNYLSIGTGAVIGDISFDDGAVSSAASPMSEAASVDGTIAQTPPSTPVPSIFLVTVNATGTYDSLKSFMEKVSSVDRLQKIVLFTLSKGDENDPSVPGINTQEVRGDESLSVTFDIEFSYLPEASYPGVHLLPIFASETFDTESVLRMMQSDQSIPELPEPTLPGRRNDPFKL